MTPWMITAGIIIFIIGILAGLKSKAWYAVAVIGLLIFIRGFF